MIQAWIISKFSSVVAKVGVTLMLFMGVFLFYEGVPFLNWWPANQIPGYGWVVEGQIYREVKTASDKARKTEEKLWLAALEEANEKKLKEINELNEEFTKISAEILKEREEAEESEQVIRSHLDRMIEEASRNNSNTDTSESDDENKQCTQNSRNILDVPIPSSVWDAID